MAPILYDLHGTPVQIGAVLGQGGEGKVLAVNDRHDCVAKIYHKSPNQRHSEKLSLMARLKSDPLLRFMAWPISTLHDKPGGPVVGMIMPRIIGKEIHLLYGPKSRLIEFPDAHWRYLIHVAGNLARAIEAVHGHGHIVGDMNDGNILVAANGTVSLIDCDSFQIQSQGTHYLCEVGIETHTPPELQGCRFREVVRKEYHDNFGLAVLIFQLLFMGRHPFSGAFLGIGDLPLGKAIAEFRFAYGSGARSRQMKPPPGTLPLEAVSTNMATMFECAFGQNNNVIRPTPQQWITELDKLQKSLKICSRHNGHYFLSSLSSCPWCDVETRSGLVLFNIVMRQENRHSKFNLPHIWTEITTIAPPSLVPYPSRPSLIHIIPSPQAVIAGQEFKKGIGVVISLLGLNKKRNQARNQIATNIKEAKNRLVQLEQRWRQETNDAPFHQKRKDLEQLRQQYIDLPNERVRLLKELEVNRERSQRKKYLDSHLIFWANIPNIGQGRKATLQSYAIETAADIDENIILNIPGFGPSLTSNLTEWRRSVERNFRFNPNIGVDKNDIAAVENRIVTKRQQLERDLANGPAQLRTIAQQISIKRDTLRHTVQQTLDTIAQAEADLSVL